MFVHCLVWAELIWTAVILYLLEYIGSAVWQELAGAPLSIFQHCLTLILLYMMLQIWTVQTVYRRFAISHGRQSCRHQRHFLLWMLVLLWMLISRKSFWCRIQLIPVSLRFSQPSYTIKVLRVESSAIQQQLTCFHPSSVWSLYGEPTWLSEERAQKTVCGKKRGEKNGKTSKNTEKNRIYIGNRFADALLYLFFIVATIIFIYPFLNVIAVSMSSNTMITTGQVTWFQENSM